MSDADIITKLKEENEDLEAAFRRSRIGGVPDPKFDTWCKAFRDKLKTNAEIEFNFRRVPIKPSRTVEDCTFCPLYDVCETADAVLGPCALARICFHFRDKDGDTS